MPLHADYERRAPMTNAFDEPVAGRHGLDVQIATETQPGKPTKARIETGKLPRMLFFVVVYVTLKP